jgi:non-specific serine/threonine protein kinase
MLELAVALTYFWSLRSRRLEGRRWLERALALARDGEIPATLHAAACHAAAALARTQDDLAGAETLAEEALARFRVLGDSRNVAAVLQLLGILARGWADFDRAARLHEEALALFRDARDPFWVALVSCDLGILAHWQGDGARATARLDEAIAGFRALDDPWGIGTALSCLALVEGDRGEVERSAALHHESLARWRQVGSKEALVDAVARIACLAVAAGRAVAGARLLGAVEALGPALGYVLERPEQARCARAVEAAREALGGEALADARVAGRALSLEQAVAEAAAVLGRLRAPKATGVGLTPRELEVLRLLAAGRSDREIAGELFISHRTVHRHVANVYAKLGVDSRAAAARAARAGGFLGAVPSSSS